MATEELEQLKAGRAPQMLAESFSPLWQGLLRTAGKAQHAGATPSRMVVSGRWDAAALHRPVPAATEGAATFIR